MDPLPPLVSSASARLDAIMKGLSEPDRTPGQLWDRVSVRRRPKAFGNRCQRNVGCMKGKNGSDTPLFLCEERAPQKGSRYEQEVRSFKDDWLRVWSINCRVVDRAARWNHRRPLRS